MPLAYYRGGNQSSLCHGLQQDGDGAGWRILRVGGDCRQCPPRPADFLRHIGVGAGESRLGAGIPKGTS